MSHFRPIRWAFVILLAFGLGRSGIALAGPPKDDGNPEKPAGQDESKSAKKKTPSKSKKSAKPAEEKILVRWGQHRAESEEDYDKRYARLLKKVVFDKEGDKEGGETRLWTYAGHPFIVRSDISQEFTANAAMYMEMLHRDYSEAFAKLLHVPAQVKEKIEVVIFKDQETYTKAGGHAGSGGQFQPSPGFEDRGPKWPARRLRLMQFTNGVADFAKWPKSVLKHEAAHLEMQLRLGMVSIPGAKISVPVDCPRWWNEGMASVFEYWDFDKTVDENFDAIPNRGRYAPVIRRLHGTKNWKDFNYVWTIDGAAWGSAMTSDQGMLNYAQAWSLAAYMMHEGKSGRRNFRQIFNLSTTVGADKKNKAGVGLRSWDVAFPQTDRDKLEKDWNAWVATNLPREKRVPDEDWMLLSEGYKPGVIDHLERYGKDDDQAHHDDVVKAQKGRKKKSAVEK